MATIACYAFNIDKTIALGTQVRLRCLSNPANYCQTQTISSSLGCFWNLNTSDTIWRIEFSVAKNTGPGSTSWPWVDVWVHLRKGQYYAITLHFGPESYEIKRTLLPSLDFPSKVATGPAKPQYGQRLHPCPAPLRFMPPQVGTSVLPAHGRLPPISEVGRPVPIEPSITSSLMAKIIPLPSIMFAEQHQQQKSTSEEILEPVGQRQGNGPSFVSGAREPRDNQRFLQCALQNASTVGVMNAVQTPGQIVESGEYQVALSQARKENSQLISLSQNCPHVGAGQVPISHIVEEEDRADKRLSVVTGAPTIKGSLTVEPEFLQGGPNLDAAQDVLGSADPHMCTLQTSEKGNLSESEDCIIVDAPVTCSKRRPKERDIVMIPRVTRSKARLENRVTRRAISFRKRKFGMLGR